MGNKKWFLLTIPLILLSLFATGPYLTIYSMKSAIVDGDSDALSDKINFPVLRENLKGQLNARVMNDVAPDLAENPFGVLAIGLATKVVDSAVDAFVTPAGITAAFTGHHPSNKGDGQRPVRAQILENAVTSWEGMDKFRVITLDESGGNDGSFVFRRNGFMNWKLTQIRIPIDAKDSQKSDSSSAPTSSTPPNPEPKPTWQYRTTPDAMSKGNIYYAMVESDPTDEPTGALVIRKHARWGKSVFIQVDNEMFRCDSNCQVLVRFDAKDPVKMKVNEPDGSNYNTLFIDAHEDFLSQMLTASQVRISARTYSSGETVLDFDVSDFDRYKYLNKVRPKPKFNLGKALENSDDYNKYRSEFVDATKKIAATKKCNVRDIAKVGWNRARKHADRRLYYTYCGGAEPNNRVYLDIDTGKLLRPK